MPRPQIPTIGLMAVLAIIASGLTLWPMIVDLSFEIVAILPDIGLPRLVGALFVAIALLLPIIAVARLGKFGIPIGAVVFWLAVSTAGFMERVLDPKPELSRLLFVPLLLGLIPGTMYCYLIRWIRSLSTIKRTFRKSEKIRVPQPALSGHLSPPDPHEPE